MAIEFNNKFYLTQYTKIFLIIKILLFKNYLQIPACMLYLQHISIMTSHISSAQQLHMTSGYHTIDHRSICRGEGPGEGRQQQIRATLSQ